MTSPFSPPEVTSAQMHNGVGPASLQGAACAWGALANQWSAAAVAISKVTTQLAGSMWQSQACQQMRRAIESVTHDLENNAGVARQAETAANTVFTAFETARATVGR